MFPGGREAFKFEDRDLVIWRKSFGMSYEEIAERLGIQPTAARMRYSRTKVRLAEIMRRQKLEDRD